MNLTGSLSRPSQALDFSPLARAIRRGFVLCPLLPFDSANNFKGCIAGIHQVLKMQGLLEGNWCLDPNEVLSKGQLEEIKRVYTCYPHLNDDEFVRKNLRRWLSE